ncbi:MAG: IclR family transcriptional regulator, partial [Clostridia bacterium]|nr:IclR family transcriptional regulator [Clostridia bacterium]
QGYVEQTPRSGRYMIGYRFFAIGSTYRYQYPFISIVEKYMEHLDPRFQENVSVLNPFMQLLNIQARESVFVPSLSPVRIRPAYASASGKVLLSYLSDKELEKMFESTEIQRFTANTIASVEALKEELNQVRQQGYATEEDEIILGRGCIAFPILDASETAIAAISLSGKVELIRSEKESLALALRDVAYAVSSELGYDVLAGPRRRRK